MLTTNGSNKKYIYNIKGIIVLYWRIYTPPSSVRMYSYNLYSLFPFYVICFAFIFILYIRTIQYIIPVTIKSTNMAAENFVYNEFLECLTGRSVSVLCIYVFYIHIRMGIWVCNSGWRRCRHTDEIVKISPNKIKQPIKFSGWCIHLQWYAIKCEINFHFKYYETYFRPTRSFLLLLLLFLVYIIIHCVGAVTNTWYYIVTFYLILLPSFLFYFFGFDILKQTTSITSAYAILKNVQIMPPLLFMIVIFIIIIFFSFNKVYVWYIINNIPSKPYSIDGF